MRSREWGTDMTITKSQYCKGIQCPKILWMDENKPEESNAVLLESIMANGAIVGELARQYYGEYSLVEISFDKQEMVEQTRRFMEDGAESIAEASFLYNGHFCAVDLLHRNGNGWDIIEVKSSTHVSSIYEDDMSFQYYILSKCGVDIKCVYNMHINNTYVRHGDLDLKELFIMENYTDIAKSKFYEVEANILKICIYMESEEEPCKDIDLCCVEPYECAYRKYCERHLSENTIFDVHGLNKKKKYLYYHHGVVSFEDILEQKPKMSAKQYMQVNATQNNVADIVNKQAIKEFLKTIVYPIYHLDFETFQQAVPEFEGGIPYAQIPFQYSLHIEHGDGTLEHKEFLAQEGIDPRKSLAERLCEDIPMGAYCLAYNMSFEKQVLEKLADTFLELSVHILDIRSNMHDLMVPFRQGDYYSKSMKGSYSIKYVLPALCAGDPELDYHQLDEVHNGIEASYAYADLGKHSSEEIVVTRNNLLKYCRLDTLAMVKILEVLRNTCSI